MPDPLGEIHQKIGRLEAHYEESARGQKLIIDTLRDIHRRLEPLSVLPGRVDEVEKIAADYARMKQRGIGVATVFALGGSVLGINLWPGVKAALGKVFGTGP